MDFTQTKKISYTNGNPGISATATVKVGFETYELTFCCELESEIEQSFLYVEFDRQFEKHIADIRQAAYEAGWRDKIKRRKKQDCFEYCASIVNPFED